MIKCPTQINLKKKKKNKNNTNSVTHFEFILFGPGLPIFTSHSSRVIVCLLHSFDWVYQKNGKNTQETIALGHTDQFVKRYRSILNFYLAIYW